MSNPISGSSLAQRTGSNYSQVTNALIIGSLQGRRFATGSGGVLAHKIYQLAAKMLSNISKLQLPEAGLSKVGKNIKAKIAETPAGQSKQSFNLLNAIKGLREKLFPSKSKVEDCVLSAPPVRSTLPSQGTSKASNVDEAINQIDKKEEDLKKGAKEFRETEISFNKDLKKLFVGLKGNKILSAEFKGEIDILKNLIRSNNKFLEQLKGAIDENGNLKTENLVGIFKNETFTELMRNISQIANILEKINEKCQSKDKKFIEAASAFKKNNNQLQLSDFFIKPIQRGPRYELLVRDMLKNLKTGDQRISQLEQALVPIKNANLETNVSKRQAEAQEAMNELKGVLEGIKFGQRIAVVDGKLINKGKGITAKTRQTIKPEGARVAMEILIKALEAGINKKEVRNSLDDLYKNFNAKMLDEPIIKSGLKVLFNLLITKDKAGEQALESFNLPATNDIVDTVERAAIEKEMESRRSEDKADDQNLEFFDFSETNNEVEALERAAIEREMEDLRKEG